MSLFDNSTLYISARSPFARRVRVMFQEHGIAFQEKSFNVFEFNPELNKHNPLRRVPVLVLANGQEIVDSNYIIQAFYEEQRHSAWMPFDRDQKITAMNWSGIAVGVCERTVETFIETQRPLALRDSSVIAENKELLKDSVERFENYIGDKKFIVGSSPTQVDIDWVIALNYLQFRFSDLFGDKYPKSFKYIVNLSGRESFKNTLPPPQ